jgi:DNA modification methylase
VAITILQGDVIEQLNTLPDGSINCCVTSPPYWGLRDYGCDGQIGLEKTPEEYTQKMVKVFREVRRVLRDDGTLWLNLGDSYASTGKEGGDIDRDVGMDVERGRGRLNKYPIIKPKDLVGIPWMVAFALRADGWYLRSDIIWSKPNPMPESVTDRPTKAHEYVFLLTKKAKYYYDADAIREPLQECSIERAKYGWNGTMVFNENGKEEYRSQPDPVDKMGERWSPTQGRNRRTVWEIATQPTPEAHFATFPEALVEPCIKAGSSERGCCAACGSPMERAVEKTRMNRTELPKNDPRYRPNQYNGAYEDINGKGDAGYTETKTTGWQPTCKCNADTKPCIVLDPFGGSGTTGLVARNLKRDCILIELNPEYIKIMKKKLRLNEQLVV